MVPEVRDESCEQTAPIGEAKGQGLIEKIPPAAAVDAPPGGATTDVVVRAGDVVAERFRLTRELGRGAMGSVWLAQHEGLGVACAVKFIAAQDAQVPEARMRFEREARAAAQIRSPYVVQIMDHGVWQGVPYIAMEYLEGETLGALLGREGRLPPGLTVRVISQVARGISKAHALRIVHRDLKPDNLFLVRDDEGITVKILDFGIAKSPPAAGESMAGTRTGMLMGTPYFMSPEQAHGMKALDHRSDLWSLAVIAYRCVVGKMPFESPALGDLLMKIMQMPLPVPSREAHGVPEAFDSFWARASKRDPARRFQSAKELSDALVRALGVSVEPGEEAHAGFGQAATLPASTGDSAPPQAGPTQDTKAPSTWTQPPPPDGRLRTLRYAGLIAALALAAGVATALFARATLGPPPGKAASPAASALPLVEPEKEPTAASPPPVIAPEPSPIASASSRPSASASPLGASAPEPSPVASAAKTALPAPRPAPPKQPRTCFDPKLGIPAPCP